VKKLVSVLLTLAVAVSLMVVPAVVSAATYSYSETWGPSGLATAGDPYTVDVTVADTGDGWLQWTYTYSENPTHTPKMTVAINYPNGFAITTFDDGSHTGWYYAPDGGPEVQLGNSVAAGWADAGGADNVRWVKIKKSTLYGTFMWHGYANVDGSQVWIEMDRTGEPWVPTAKVTLEPNTAVGLTAETPTITAISVDPTSIDFGTVNPGDVVSGPNITVENIGTVKVSVDANLDPQTGTVFNYLKLNGVPSPAYCGDWTDYIISSLDPSGIKSLTTVLDVPPTYTAQGSEATTLIFEATAL